MFRCSTTLAAIALLGGLAAAQPVTYAQRTTGIRAGVLLVDSNKLGVTGVPANDTPHVWFNLDANSAAKPPGWSFYNPRASTQVSASVQSRWTLIASVVGGGAPAVGARITKRDAPYWEVPLSSAGDQEMADYDVLVFSGYRLVSLNPIEREKLRRFMDGGGVLWLDFTTGTQLDGINPFPVPFQLNAAPLGAVRSADFFDPLLSYPNAVNDQSVAAMETSGTFGLVTTSLSAQGIAQLEPILSPLETDSLKFKAVAADNVGVSIASARVGDGFLVVTTHGVATALNRVVDSSGNYNANRQYQALNATFDRASNAAAKLVLNMVHLRSENGQANAGSRKSGTTAIDVGAPLLRRFDAPVSRTPSTLSHIPPAAYKGIMATVSDDRIYVFDSNPSADLDGDGNPDDGIADYATGSNLDLIWVSAPMTGPISSPTCFEIPNPAAGVAKDQVVVVDARGRINAFNLFPLDANGRLQALPNAASIYQLSPPGGPPTYDLGLPGRGPYAPTMHEGMLYVSDTQDTGFNKVGRVWIADPAIGRNVQTGATSWSVGGAGTQFIGDPSWSPTVGYIEIQDNSGGLDRVVYVPSRPNPSVAGPNSTAGITSLWLGVRGERVSRPEVQGNQLELPTRASLQGLDIFLPGVDFKQLGVKVTMVHPNGDPYSAAEMAARFTGRITQFQGRLNVELTGAGIGLVTNEINPLAATQAVVRVDYSIDWGTGSPNVTGQIIRGQVYLPDNNAKARRILHGIAMGADGTIFVAHSNQINGGAFYALREEGRGSFRLVYRYDMYREHSIRLNQASPVRYRETLTDSDGITQLPGMSGILGGVIQQLHFDGGPVVRDGTVYVVAGGHKGTGFIQVPLSIVMAFKAQPGTSEIRTEDLGTGFSIVQPDIARSSNTALPEVFSTLQPNQYVYERNRGGGTIRIDNLMATTRGPMLNALSTSQPIIIRRSGQPDLLIEPDRNGSTWSPLDWYVVLHGLRNHSPAFVSGSTAFVSGSSSLPSIVTSGSPFPTRGMVMGFDSMISPNDPFLIPASDRPWLNQLYQLKYVAGTVNPNPDMRWPQNVGVTSFEDWRVRLLQTVLGTSTDAEGVIGGDGALFAWSDIGVWGFTREDLLVCDEGRLLRVDPSGNPIWTSDTTLNAGTALEVNATGNIKKLVRPTKAYRTKQNEMLVVDTGADRIVRLDTSGRELRSIGGFSIDPLFKPEGLEAGAPNVLRQPRDVVTYTSYETSPPMSNPQALEYWVHYLIADTGNRRLLELVDRYEVDPVTRRVRGVVTDANGNAALGVLWWHSPSALSGKEYAYNGLARVFNQTTGRYVYAASIGGSMPTRVDTGLDTPVVDPRFVRTSSTGNGGVVLFDGAGTVIVNEILVPPLGPDVFWNDNPSSGLPRFVSGATVLQPKSLTNLNSVTMRYVPVAGGGSEIAMMLTDASGVYEVVLRPDPRPAGVRDPSGNAWVVRWMLPREAFRVIRRAGSPIGQPWLGSPVNGNPRDFRPTFARRLDSGEVLVVNGWAGPTRGNSAYQGEVLHIDGDVDATETNATKGFGFTKVNLGFYSSSIKAELPPIQGARGLVLPVFADRR